MAEETAKPTSSFSKGLEGVVVGETRLSHVDGENSKLSYQGIDIQDLAKHSTYEEAVYLLWFQELPTKDELQKFCAELTRHRELPREIVELIRTFPRKARPMDVLRSAISALALYDPDAQDLSREANLRKGVRLVASIPAIVATFHRFRTNKERVSPRKDLSHAANFIYLLTGKPPSKLAEQALDRYLLLLADHGFNASTFAARVTISTLSDIYSAVTAAIGTLKGALHGGANEKTMELLLQIGKVENAEETIRRLLNDHQKVPGFGHRIYKIEDPRATVFREMSRRLTSETGNEKWFQISEKVEELMRSQKHIACNVDFYSASALYSIGIPIDLFTTVFAASRVAGWIAHILEQLSDNRLIRPQALYVGPVNRSYADLANRGAARKK